jgi:hypothetical protein
MSRVRPESRTSVMAVLIGVPALVAAIGLTALEGYRLLQPTATLFEEAPASLAESLTGGFGVEYSFRFIRAGQNPNEPIVISDPDYTGGRTIAVSPLMLAVAARDSNATSMLFTAGARLDLPQNQWAWCLALEIGDRMILTILDRFGGRDLPQTCPDRTTKASLPLLRWIE